MQTKIKIRIFLWSLLVLLVCFLLYQAIVPSGQVVYNYDFNKPNIFIGQLTPTARTMSASNGQQKIIGDPVYFDLYLPRSFEQAKVSLDWSEQTVPVMELGMLVDETAWHFDLQPLVNLHLEEVASNWSALSEAGLWLYQRQPEFDSLAEFLNDLPPAQHIAVYNYDLPVNFVLPDYQPSQVVNNFTTPLQGDYQFYTYIKNEDLWFDFSFVDLVTKPLVELYDLSGQKITQAQPALGQKNIVLEQSNLSSGVYRLVVKADQQAITSSIETKQQYLSFINKIHLAPTSQPFELYTDSPIIRVQTEIADGLQTIVADDEPLAVLRSHEQFSLSGLTNKTKLELEQGGVLLSGKGVFSWQADILNPNYQQVDTYFDLNEDIDYIVAKYQPAMNQAGKFSQTVDFNLETADLIKGKYRFILSVPGLLAEDKVDDYLILENIKIELFGKSLWQKVQEILN